MGPRAIRNKKRYIQQAIYEKEQESKLKSKQMIQDTRCVYESTAAAAQKHVAFISKLSSSSSLDGTLDMNMSVSEMKKNILEKKDHNDHAITFWSHHLLQSSPSLCSTISSSSSSSPSQEGLISRNEKNDSNPSNLIPTKRTSFAKCTSFTNDPYSSSSFIS